MIADRRRAVVTGGAGFIGSHLVERLRADGWSVLVLDDLSTGRADDVPADVELVAADLLDADLPALLRRWRAATVFHLAAQASVARSTADPVRDLAVNVEGTIRVAAAAREAACDRLVFVSSGGAVYGETIKAATERTLPAPTSPYGVDKLAAEGHVRIAGVPWAIARPANVYGERQRAGLEGAVVASFLDRVVRREALEIHGDGRQTRDFVHVSDAVAALLRLADPAVPDGTWNVATGRSVSIAGLADLVERLAGTRLERRFGPRRTGDVRASAMSARRLRGLGWRPEVSLAAGIGRLVAAAGEPRLTAPTNGR